MAVEINFSELQQHVQSGKKKADIAKIYGLNHSQVCRLMKEADLSFRRYHQPAFKLIKDVNIIPSSGENLEMEELFPLETPKVENKEEQNVVPTEYQEVTPKENWDI